METKKKKKNVAAQVDANDTMDDSDHKYSPTNRLKELNLNHTQLNKQKTIGEYQSDVLG